MFNHMTEVCAGEIIRVTNLIKSEAIQHVRLRLVSGIQLVIDHWISRKLILYDPVNLCLAGMRIYKNNLAAILINKQIHHKAE